jgi:hypothetical protein
MDRWQDDGDFREAARVLWPDEFDLAASYARPRGHAAAVARMQHRYEGFRALRGLARIRDSLDRIIRRATGVQVG